jgi:hypothetical protein
VESAVSNKHAILTHFEYITGLKSFTVQAMETGVLATSARFVEASKYIYLTFLIHKCHI